MFDRRSTADIDLQEVKKDFDRLNAPNPAHFI